MRGAVIGVALLLAVCAVAVADAPALPDLVWRRAWTLPAAVPAESAGLWTPTTAVSDVALALPGERGTVSLLDPHTGTLRRSVAADPASPAPITGLWVASGTLVVARGSAQAPVQALSAYDVATGARLWRRTVIVAQQPETRVYGGPRIMVTGHSIVIVGIEAEPVIVFAVDLRSGTTIAQASGERGCVMQGAATARSILLLSHCPAKGHVALSAVDPRTLRRVWTRSLRSHDTPGDMPLDLTAGTDGYAHVTVGNDNVFTDADGRLLPVPGAATGWSRPLYVGSYPAIGPNGELELHSRWPLPAFLIAVDLRAGRLTGLPLDVPAQEANLIGVTRDMAFVHRTQEGAEAIIVYRRYPGRATPAAVLGGVAPAAWPDACSLLSGDDLRILGDDYRAIPSARALGPAKLPRPAACDWVSTAGGGPAVSLSLDWVSATSTEARALFAAEVAQEKSRSSFDPGTDSAQVFSFVTSHPAGIVGMTLVGVGPVVVRMTSVSRQALHLLAPVLRDNLRARYRQPLAPSPPMRGGWNRPTYAVLPIELVVSRGTVYAGADDMIHALAAASGRPRWSYRLGSDVAAAPVVSGGVVYVAVSDGRVVALDASTGRARWSRRLGAQGDLVVAAGRVHVNAGDSAIAALDAADGRTLWRFQAGGALRVPTSVSSGVVYSGSDHGTVYAVDARTGRARWRSRIAGRSDPMTVVAADGLVHAGSESGVVHALDAATGAPRWRARLGSLAFGPLVIGGTIYAGGLGTTYALDASTGRRLWTFSAPGDRLYNVTAPTVARGLAYLGGPDGKLHALEATSGRERWNRSAEAGNGITVVDGTVYTGGDGDSLLALDAATGAIRWSAPIGGEIGREPVVSGGLVYVGSSNGIVYAIPLRP
ncbi:outer membrane protein assembly factor BamB family protein [[Actinomadura] parvosata]|uniref:outer membrane protein assembly factor BamB family protein n=1 Tax=[Actinomadura] parvosata TaxID=1955412 RepID=UPI00406D499D